MDTLISIDYELRDYQGDHQIYFDRFAIDITHLPDFVFTFKEAENFFITFKGSKKVSIEVESLDDGKMVPLRLHRKYNLSKGVYADDSYFAGYFKIAFIYENRRYESCFMVEPNNADYQSIMNLRNYVNYYYEGLSKDLSKKVEGKIRGNRRGKNESNIYENIQYFRTYFPSTLNNIHAYGRRNHHTITSTYQLTPSYKRIDAKSIRYLTTKGLAHNKDIMHPELMYGKKAVSNDQNEENQYFKYLLQFFEGELKKVIFHLNYYIKARKDEEEQKKELLTQVNQKYANVVNQNEIASNIKENLKKIVTRSNKELASLREQIDEHLETRKEMEKYLHIVSEYLDRYHHIQIKRNLFPIRITNAILRNIEEQRKHYLNHNIHVQQEEMNYREKSTPKLYETYVYILLINLLGELGYQPIHQEANFDMMYSLSNTSKFTLVKDDQYVDILYDHELKKTNSEFLESEYCYLNSYHNRPDFILSFYKQGQIPSYSIIIEAKWRNKKYVYNEFEDTNVVLHLRDYLNLVYYDLASHKKIRGIITKVIVVYPNMEEEIVQIEDEEIMGVSIFPSTSIEQSANYQYLLEELNKSF